MTDVVLPSDSMPLWRRRGLGAAAGLLSAAAGVGASLLVSRIIGSAPTPVEAVGARAIDATPRAVKDWAVRTLGTADKTVLLSGIFIVLVLLACLIGVVAWRSRLTALSLATLLGLVGLAAAYADRTRLVSAFGKLAPALAALIVSVGLLAWFTTGWDRRSALHRPEVPNRPGSSESERSPNGLTGSGSTADAPPGFDRRAFLAAAAVSGAVAATGAVSFTSFGSTVGARSRSGVRLPAPASPAPPLARTATLDVNGITPYLTNSGDFYRVDTALSVPQVAAKDWRLRIHGLVDSELELTYEDLLAMPLVERRITLMCVSNEVGGDLTGNASWLGVRVADLLRRAGPSASADAVKSTSIDGFTVGTPLAALTDGRDALVAIGMNGKPLPLEHGFPARVVVPGLYGYVSATKWVADMEVTKFADFTAYWTDRGWAEKAAVKTESRIDVPAGDAQLKAGRVAVAGVAWAQHTGIAAVQVQVDNGPWQQARLATEDSIDTWRQWVYHWNAVPGSHDLRVRATDKSGYTQTSHQAPPPPNGATGWHTVSVTVT